MPPRLNLVSSFRSLSIRSQPLAAQRQCIAAAQQQARRPLSTNEQPPKDEFSEALRAKMDAFRVNPDRTSEQKSQQPPKQPRQELTDNELALIQLEQAAYGLNPFDPLVEGHKFGVPMRATTADVNFKTRYNSVVDQFTKCMMWDGKLAKAQRDMAIILNYIRSSPPPKLNPARPLMPGAPTPAELAMDPVLYLTFAVDSVAPLIKMRGFPGLAGGGKSLEVPVPMAQRQRRRAAIGWILDVVAKKPSKGSGRTMFPHRVAEEIVAVMEGRSSVWDKRQQIHKQGTANRANMYSSRMRGVAVM
ncbi:hypothetical protein OQA88_9609 [Cercophora sp. LCS_1]